MLQLLLAFLIVTLACIARAERLLPADAKPATLRAHEYPYVKLDRKVIKLAPGAVIYDPSNRTILPGSLPERSRVLYRLDANGDVSRIWLLTAEEPAPIRK